MSQSTLGAIPKTPRGASVENGAKARSVDASPRLTLEGLAALDAEALGAIYAKGSPPDLRDLDGTPRGRMLALAGPLGHGRPFDVLRRFAGSRHFPWEGKSFRSDGADRGKGINRVRGLGDWFRFETRIGPSALDAKPCLVLDYDVRPNPWAIRQIHDELRQVSPRLFLGPAMWKARPRHKLVLFFAIAT
jgi:hypothetical protein